MHLLKLSCYEATLTKNITGYENVLSELTFAYHLIHLEGYVVYNRIATKIGVTHTAYILHLYSM